jgi:DNA polymerase III alpha subunit
MDAVEAIGLVKMDILAQGGLAAMRDTKSFLAERGIAVDLRALEPWNDPEIWAMISSGGARGVHHIESPAMLGLSKMVGVHTIDDLIAIVSVIRPGASNNLKKESFARRAQGLEPVDYTHPSLAGCLRATYGVVAYEEHILQICEAFAGLPGGRADVLRRALVKCQQDKIVEVGKEFVEHARALGRTDEEIRAVWTLVDGFQGYAFCRAHSTAYGIEAYQAAHLKRYFPVEFLASVLTNGKGFYGRLVYSIECRRLGIGFLPPDINRSRNGFHPEEGNIRVPLSAIKGLGRRTIDACSAGHPFSSMRDFYLRCRPGGDEMDALIRVGAFDGFGEQRTSQFWQFRELSQWGGCTLFPAAGNAALPDVPLREPEVIDNLRAEQELLGFPVSGHPLDMFPGIAWKSYCPVSDLARFCGQRVTVCGLIIEDRIHPQSNGKNMKFLSVCDRSGILECELFASTYNRFGIETIRHPVVEITGTVARNEPGTGHTLRVGRIQKPRTTG